MDDTVGKALDLLPLPLLATFTPTLHMLLDNTCTLPETIRQIRPSLEAGQPFAAAMRSPPPYVFVRNICCTERGMKSIQVLIFPPKASSQRRQNGSESCQIGPSAKSDTRRRTIWAPAVPGKEWDSWNRFRVRNQVWFRTRPEFCCRTRSTCLLNVAGQQLQPAPSSRRVPGGRAHFRTDRGTLTVRSISMRARRSFQRGKSALSGPALWQDIVLHPIQEGELMELKWVIWS